MTTSTKERWLTSISMMLAAVIGAPIAGAIISLPYTLPFGSRNALFSGLALGAGFGLILGAAGGLVSVIYYSFRNKFDGFDAFLTGSGVFFSAVLFAGANFHESMFIANLAIGAPISIVFGGLPAVVIYIFWVKLLHWLHCRLSSRLKELAK
ncbi:MAG TPA: hypothetical protein VLA00_07825 [Xanthobacteraceae bacterium]|nr:hypothetical protein [Xanthobacteraceae bacterium]